MGIENISSPEGNSEAIESLQASSEPQRCQHDGDCQPGFKCVNGECVPE